MVGSVGNGEGVMIAGINIVMGVEVGKTIVGTDVSSGRAGACLLQADRKVKSTIQITFLLCCFFMMAYV